MRLSIYTEYQITKVARFLKTRFCSLRNYVRFGSVAVETHEKKAWFRLLAHSGSQASEAANLSHRPEAE
jgi:hypothetical protein